MSNDRTIISLSQAKILDQKASEVNHIPPLVLMEEAAGGLYAQLQKDFPYLHNEKIAVFAGWGNNGGDAFALARRMFFDNIKFDLFVFADKDDSELNAIQKDILLTLSISCLSIDDFFASDKKYTLIIDALFGIGYSYREDELLQDLFHTIGKSQAKVVAIDIPSGLTRNNTQSVMADYTYSIGFLKDIFYSLNTRKYLGNIYNIPISFKLSNIQYEKTYHSNQSIGNILPMDNFVHKYSRGAVLSIGGSIGMCGSIIFTAKSALAVGSGISLVLTEKANIEKMNVMAIEIIFDYIENYEKYLSKYNTIIVGPGLGEIKKETVNVLKSIFKMEKTFILDASFFSNFDKSILKEFTVPPLLTPHTGEFINFFKIDGEVLRSNTISIVKETAIKNNCYILYKDVFMILATPDNVAYIFDYPTRLGAQAGSGDILVGIIAGLYAQTNSLVQSVHEGISMFYGVLEFFNENNFRAYSPFKFIEYLSKIGSDEKK